MSFRRDPPVRKNPTVRFAELAGVKTAECAAICCCCPFGLIDLIVLAVVRLPVGLFNRAVRKRIRRSRTKARSEWNSGSGSGSSFGSGSGSDMGSEGSDGEFFEFAGFLGGGGWPERSPAEEVVQLEKDVWSKFCNSGFWRSMSQREDLLTAEMTAF